MDLLEILRQQEERGFTDDIPQLPQDAPSDDEGTFCVGEGGTVALGQFENNARRPPKLLTQNLVEKHRVFFSGPPPDLPAAARDRQAATVVVSNVKWWVDDSTLRKGAAVYGQVRAVRILDDARTGKSHGVALVEFVDESAAAKALRDEGQGLKEAAELSTVPTVSPVDDRVFQLLEEGGGVHWGVGGSVSRAAQQLILQSADTEDVVVESETRRDAISTEKDRLVSQWLNCGLSEILRQILEERRAGSSDDDARNYYDRGSRSRSPRGSRHGRSAKRRRC